VRLLIVEDEEDIALDIGRALQSMGFAVDYSRDGEDGWFKGSTESYAAIILDVGLPNMDGVTVLKNWRKEGVTTPVIMLTARGNWTDKVDGIESGADDYMSKPFHIEELAARNRALVRRGGGIAAPVLEAGDLRLDTRSSTVTLAGVKLQLSPLEYRLLAHLMFNRGRTVSQSELLDSLYGAQGEPGSNAVEVLMRRLRKKIGTDLIATQRGFGYMMTGPEP
jgi:two-component system, OmpR family, response regulator